MIKMEIEKLLKLYSEIKAHRALFGTEREAEQAFREFSSYNILINYTLKFLCNYFQHSIKHFR